jgi:glycyl-tRNA synthetase beta chain
MARGRNGETAKSASLLVELLTEELPPGSLQRLAETFAAGVLDGLRARFLANGESRAVAFATPRRLAVRIVSVPAKQPDRTVERKGPSVKAGLDAAGRPTPALLGFARSCGAEVAELERRSDDKGEYFLHRAAQKGEPLAVHLAAVVEAALRKLPVAKLMRWGAGEAEFVRPLHGLVMLHGARVVPGAVLGMKSGNRTLGHRFLCRGALAIPGADRYETVLEKRGRVIASFEKRRAAIERGLDRAAARIGRGATWRIGGANEVLDEVTSIVEFPQVQAGAFDENFLDVPRECLIVSMQQHQRYFPIAAGAGRLLGKFLFVANVPAGAGGPVARGNERVLRARLADARFFYVQDRKTRLDARVPQLAGVVFHNKLGSQLERVERIRQLAQTIAKSLKYDVAAAGRAAYLAKADLLTDMVGEFPELQGTMGRYYALHDGEPQAVADAIEEHYRPRFAGDAIPGGPVGTAVALADKLDTLAGMFGILQTPTGDKDPFGMRRAALGVVRILVERELPLSVYDLVKSAFADYRGRVGEATNFLETFIFERLAGYCRDLGYTTLEVDAVVSLRPALIHLVPRQLEAVRAFSALPEADSLVAANKRVANILRQAAAKGETFGRAEPGLLREDAERSLHEALRGASERAAQLSGAGDFTGCLKTLAVLKTPVDAFFDKVMVMVEDAALRRNRLALLAELRNEMNRLADISRLSA